MSRAPRARLLAAPARAADHRCRTATTMVALPNPRLTEAADTRSAHSAPAADAALGWKSLTETEQKVALLIANAHTNRAAATALFVSPNTIATHLRSVFNKLNVNSRVQLTRIVLQQTTEVPMDDREQALLRQVATLVEQERVLREQLADPQERTRIEDRATLRSVEEELDQCWDLLRQRRALQAVHADPEAARVRPVSQVENYLPRPGGPS